MTRVRTYRLVALSIVAVMSSVPALETHASRPSGSQDHAAWVADALKRMQAVKPGMTRADLLPVFTTEGGLSTGIARTYVYRDCPYFKVDVEFEPVGRPARDGDGRVTLAESSQDVIKNVSRPYLALEHHGLKCDASRL